MLTRIVRYCEEARRSNLIIILLFPIYLFAQNQTAIRYSQFITAFDIKQYITVLASDSLEGRETGKPGQKKAADYIAKQFESFGIPKIDSGYFQKYTIYKSNQNNISVSLNGEQLELGKQFYHESNFSNDTITSSSFFFYHNGDVVPMNAIVFVSEKEVEGEKLNTLKKYKPKAIFIIQDKKIFENKLKRANQNNRSYNFYPTTNSCILYISQKTYKKFEQKNFRGHKTKLKYKIEIKSFVYSALFSGENILGYIEGGYLKNELIVVSAHYDHLGFHDGKIYHGADDDASGTSAVIALAKAFAQAKKEGHGPRRSILFLAFSGEEKGLLGSSYYSDHPVFPLENTVADLNIDMIGRLDAKHDTNANYVYIIGSDKLSSELDSINKSVNQTYTKLDLDYTFNDPADPNRFYYRSDHYNFAKHNIPVIFYFNGVHEDYHKPTDTVDKINFDKVEKISKLVFFTTWELANRDKRIVVDKENDFKGTR